MKKPLNILFSLLTILLGLFLLGFGYTTKLGHPISTICFLSGLVLFPLGFVYLIIGLRKLTTQTHSQKINILNFEKQSGNWNSNLYDLCLSNVKSILAYRYDHKAFGSWFIESKNKRLVYEGKDCWLILQNRDSNDWKDEIILKKEELNETNLFSLLSKM